MRFLPHQDGTSKRFHLSDCARELADQVRARGGKLALLEHDLSRLCRTRLDAAAFGTGLAELAAAGLANVRRTGRYLIIEMREAA